MLFRFSYSETVLNEYSLKMLTHLYNNTVNYNSTTEFDKDIFLPVLSYEFSFSNHTQFVRQKVEQDK